MWYWYSWFCLEGSSVAPKTHFWGFQRAAHMGPHLTDFDSQRPAPRLARFDYRNSFLTKPFWNEINLDVTYSLSQKKLQIENKRLCWETRFWTKVTQTGPDLPKQCLITWMAQSDNFVSQRRPPNSARNFFWTPCKFQVRKTNILTYNHVGTEIQIQVQIMCVPLQWSPGWGDGWSVAKQLIVWLWF